MANPQKQSGLGSKQKHKQEGSSGTHEHNETTTGGSGGHMGAGQSGKENMGSEKPSDGGERSGSQKPGHS